MRKLPLVLGLLLALPAYAPAFGWSEPGHMTTGAIAYDDLARRRPDVLPEIDRILAAHPDRARLEAHVAGLTGAARQRRLFEWLARWADDIRGGAWDHPDWHYELRVVSGWSWAWPFRNGSASSAFAINYATFHDAHAPLADRAQALGWLLHIIGDIQQPLHAGHAMNWDFPKTDRAGTIDYVRPATGGAAIALHDYWDARLDRPGAAEATPDAWALPLQAAWPRAKLAGLVRPGSATMQFGAWLDESRDLARDFAYSDAFLHASADPATAPHVSPGYAAKANLLAGQRVATGGYRIADTLIMGLAK